MFNKLLSNFKLKRYSLYLLIMIGFLAMTVLFFSSQNSVKAQSVNAPSAPTNVTATVGDTEATISWTIGADGSCRTNDVYVVVYKEQAEVDDEGNIVYTEKNSYTVPLMVYKHAEESEFISRSFTSWHVDELTASTKYEAYVWAYGESCDQYSYHTDAKVTFTTNAATATGDPTRTSSNNKKKIPRRVREFTATPSGTSVTLTWKKPNVGNPSRRCQPDTNIKYTYDIVQLNPYEYLAEFRDQAARVSSSGDTVTVTVNGLTSGVEYEAAVNVYSRECGEYSRYRYQIWTQP